MIETIETVMPAIFVMVLIGVLTVLIFVISLAAIYLNLIDQEENENID